MRACAYSSFRSFPRSTSAIGSSWTSRGAAVSVEGTRTYAGKYVHMHIPQGPGISKKQSSITAGGCKIERKHSTESIQNALS